MGPPKTLQLGVVQVRLDPDFKVGEGEPLRMLKYGEAGLGVARSSEVTLW